LLTLAAVYLAWRNRTFLSIPSAAALALYVPIVSIAVYVRELLLGVSARQPSALETQIVNLRRKKLRNPLYRFLPIVKTRNSPQRNLPTGPAVSGGRISSWGHFHDEK